MQIAEIWEILLLYYGVCWFFFFFFLVLQIVGHCVQIKNLKCFQSACIWTRTLCPYCCLLSLMWNQTFARLYILTFLWEIKMLIHGYSQKMSYLSYNPPGYSRPSSKALFLSGRILQLHAIEIRSGQLKLFVWDCSQNPRQV